MKMWRKTDPLIPHYIFGFLNPISLHLYIGIFSDAVYFLLFFFYKFLCCFSGNKGGNLEGVDSLDHFMSSLGTSIDKATRTKLRRVVVELKKVLEKLLFCLFCIFAHWYSSMSVSDRIFLLFYVILIIINVFWLHIRKGKDFLNSWTLQNQLTCHHMHSKYCMD